MKRPSKEKIILLFESKKFRRVLLFLIAFTLLFNGRQYPHGNGFDYGAHRDYARHLYETGTTPNFEQSRAAYNPPVFYYYCAGAIWISEHVPLIKGIRSAKIAKIGLALISFGWVLLTMRICGWILGEKSQTPYILFLCTTPSFYRASAMYIPEVFLSAIIWLALFHALRSWKNKGFITTSGALKCSLLLALAVWTRTLAFAAVAGWGLSVVYCFLKGREDRKRWAVTAGIIVSISTIACLSLFAFNISRLGKAIPFVEKNKFHKEIPAYSRQPASFYYGLELKTLFSNPVRPNLGNHLLPVFYSDYWGDYWKYWVYDRKEEVPKTLRRVMLSIQNLSALLPTFIIIIGLCSLIVATFRTKLDQPIALFVPIAFLLFTGCALYMYYVVSVPHPNTSQVKSTYVCFLMPILAMGAAHGFRKILDHPEKISFWIVPYCLLFWIWSWLGSCLYPY